MASNDSLLSFDSALLWVTTPGSSRSLLSGAAGPRNGGGGGQALGSKRRFNILAGNDHFTPKISHHSSSSEGLRHGLFRTLFLHPDGLRLRLFIPDSDSEGHLPTLFSSHQRQRPHGPGELLPSPAEPRRFDARAVASGTTTKSTWLFLCLLLVFLAHIPCERTFMHGLRRAWGSLNILRISDGYTWVITSMMTKP